jgi:hypothetical protein
MHHIARPLIRTLLTEFILHLAVAGTLILEWAKLTEYTGNKTYLELAEKSMRRIGMNVGTFELTLL